MVFRALIAFVCVFWATNVSAQWPALTAAPAVEATGANDAALIIAIDDYLLLPDIPGAVANANDWDVFFTNGLKIPEVFVLTNQDATRESILKFAKMSARNVKPGGTLWVVFIGHGAPTTKGEGLLVGADAQQSIESLEARGVKQSELLSALSASSQRTVMVLDACFSGRTTDGQALAKGVQPVVPLDTVKLPPNTILLSASKSTEVAGQLEGQSRPAFSYLALGAMRGWADDGDGAVSASEVLAWSQRKLRGVKGRQQTPQGFGPLDEVLTSKTKETEPDVGAIVSHCPEGQILNDGTCETVVIQSDASDAERTLEYMKRRIKFDDNNIAFIGPRELDPIGFYHEIGRPDLADEYSTNNPYMWVPGIVATVLGVGLLSYGISQARESDAWFIGGFFGGSLLMTGGMALTTVGIIMDYDPMSVAQKYSAAEVYNRGVREELKLGPEVDWDNRRPSNSGFWPFSGLTPRTPMIGARFEF
jgi:hypothetical protein